MTTPQGTAATSQCVTRAGGPAAQAAETLAIDSSGEQPEETRRYLDRGLDLLFGRGLDLLRPRRRIRVNRRWIGEAREGGSRAKEVAGRRLPRATGVSARLRLRVKLRARRGDFRSV